ncbi:hypothetical protein CQA38_06900 [Campylobacter sp. MIT 12-5580]|nr:hypothetical protein CQA38_06900 [Campylobacter sp. MIT 12-5580]
MDSQTNGLRYKANLFRLALLCPTFLHIQKIQENFKLAFFTLVKKHKNFILQKTKRLISLKMPRKA